MTAAELKRTVNLESPPAGLPVLVQAMWWAAHGDWEKAHQIAQEISTREGAWVHAYLHRAEGDMGNAGYWYRQAAQPSPRVRIDQEWEQVTSALLGVSTA